METYHSYDDSEPLSSFSHFDDIYPSEAEFIKNLLTFEENRYVHTAEIEYDVDTQTLWVRVIGHDHIDESPIAIVDRLVTSVVRLREPKSDYTSAA